MNYSCVTQNCFVTAGGAKTLTMLDQVNIWDERELGETCESLQSFLEAIRQFPIIRYQKSSLMAHRLAHSLQLKEEFPRLDSPPILLIIDRRLDMLTPLLQPWTYLAMLHEMGVVTNGRVSLVGHQYSLLDDEFWMDHWSDHWGQVGEEIQSLVTRLDEKSTMIRSRLQDPESLSILQVREWVESLPHLQRMTANASQHVQMATELGRLVEEHGLLGLSEAEQTLLMSEHVSAEVKFQFLSLVYATD